MRNQVKVLILIALVILGGAIGLFIRGTNIFHPGDTLDKTTFNSGSPLMTPTVTATPKPQQYTLSIDAQRERKYPGSDITIESQFEMLGDVRTQVISYYSDGLKIYAQVVAPTTPEPKNRYPTMILAHGYIQPDGYTTDEAFYTDFAAEYAKQGYLVIKPDLRGHGRSWGTAEGAYYSAGYVADILNLDASLSDYSPANTEQISLFGHSMGAHVALVAMTVRPQFFKSVILAAGAVGMADNMYLNWVSFSDYGNPVTSGTRARVIRLFGPPSEDSDFWKSAEPYSFLSEKMPRIYIAHSTNDTTVPYAFSQQLAAKIEQATFDTYNSGHGFDGPERAVFIQNSLKFVNKK